MLGLVGQVIHVDRLGLSGDGPPIGILEFFDKDRLAELKGEDAFALGRVEENTHIPGVRAWGGKENREVSVRGPKNGLTVGDNVKHIMLCFGHSAGRLVHLGLECPQKGQIKKSNVIECRVICAGKISIGQIGR